jgi:hypothetical protein
MSIFTIIKNKLFSKKNKVHNLKKNSIIIHVYEDGFYDLDLDLNYYDKDKLKILSKMFYEMSAGNMGTFFISGLIDQANKNPQNSVYLLEIITEWNKLSANKNKKIIQKTEGPLIRPSQVFHH